MPLISISPPQAVTDAIQVELNEMATKQHFKVTALKEVAPNQMSLSSAHPVYNLGLDQVLADIDLESLVQTNWRYIVHRSDTGGVAAAESLPHQPGKTVQLASVNVGPFVESTLVTLQNLDKAKEVTQGDWEVRLLRIPALYIVAVWLHERTKGDNLIRVLQPAPVYLNPEKFYPWHDFKALVKDEASQKLRFDDQPQPSKG